MKIMTMNTAPITLAGEPVAGKASLLCLDEGLALPSVLSDQFDRIGRLARCLVQVPHAWVIREGSRADHCDMTRPRERERRMHGLAQIAGLRFFRTYPLRDPGGHRLGTLVLADVRPRRVGATVAGRIALLAETLASELALEASCTTDPLTRLLNRTGLGGAAGGALTLANRLGTPVSLVYVDLNGFKQINDLHGHNEGDEALKAFAQMMRRAFRASDLVARLGGDEFVALAMDDRMSVAAPVRRLARLVDQYNRCGGKPYQLAFSVGCSEWSGRLDDTLDTLLAQADQRMYAHKRKAMR